MAWQAAQALEREAVAQHRELKDLRRQLEKLEVRNVTISDRGTVPPFW